MSPDALTVDLEIEPPQAWLTFVGATTSCLRALGIDCDQVDVSGYSGYAFSLSVNRGLCPSGPTCVDWGALAAGIHSLGRSALVFTSWDCHTRELGCERTREHCRVAFDLIRAEVAAGRPCVAWGLGLPEFGVVRGVDGDDLLCVAAGPIPERVRYDEVDAPGGPAVYAFPSETKVSPQVDFHALQRALERLTIPGRPTGWTAGLAAWDYWAAELAAGEAITWSNSYNAQCWAEARRAARDFIGRLASRHEGLAVPLGAAHAALDTVAGHVGAVAEACPFDCSFNADPITDAPLIEELTAHLRAAKAAEQKAIQSLHESLRAIPA